MSSISNANILSVVENDLDQKVDQRSIDVGCYEIDYRTKKNVLVEEPNNGFVADCEYFEYLANNPADNFDLINSVSKNYPIEYKQTSDSAKIFLPSELKMELDLISTIHQSSHDLSMLFSIFDYFTNEMGFHKVRLLNDEFTSSEAYQNQFGDCTEMTKLMLSSLKYLGFDVQAVFVYEDVFGEEVNHVCVGVKMENGETVLIDPIYGNYGFNVKHKYIPLTMRQFWSFNENYFGSADLYSKKYSAAANHFSAAMSIYDHDYSLYFNAGLAFYYQNDPQNALLYFKKSDEIIPNDRAKSFINYLSEYKANDIKALELRNFRNLHPPHNR